MNFRRPRLGRCATGQTSSPGRPICHCVASSSETGAVWSSGCRSCWWCCCWPWSKPSWANGSVKRSEHGHANELHRSNRARRRHWAAPIIRPARRGRHSIWMTSLLLRILGARVDEAVRIAQASLAFRGGLGAGWYALLLLGFGAVIFMAYRGSPAVVRPVRRRVLAALRVTFLGLILLLVLRPVLSFTVEGSVRRVLVMLLDTSASMQLKDPLTNERLNLLPRLDREFDLDAFSFSQGVAPIAARKDKSFATNAQPRGTSAEQFAWVDRLDATNSATAIGDAVREIINRKRGQPLAGIVLATDGANNSGSSPREAAALARQEGAPLYIYGVGITSPRDIIVGNLFAPDVTFVKDEAPVTVRVRSQGLRGETAELVLKLGGEKVATRTITFAGDGEQVVPLKFAPQVEGEFDLQAFIEPRPDEAVKDNNLRTQRLRVIDAKIQALLVDQSPRWEFRYLQAMLLRDRRVNLKCYLVEGDPGIARATNSPYLAQFPAKKEELFKYDLVIFGDVDPRRIPPAPLANLNELVSKFGGALVMVAGKRFW